MLPIDGWVRRVWLIFLLEADLCRLDAVGLLRFCRVEERGSCLAAVKPEIFCDIARECGMAFFSVVDGVGPGAFLVDKSCRLTLEGDLGMREFGWPVSGWTFVSVIDGVRSSWWPVPVLLLFVALSRIETFERLELGP